MKQPLPWKSQRSSSTCAALVALLLGTWTLAAGVTALAQTASPSPLPTVNPTATPEPTASPSPGNSDDDGSSYYAARMPVATVAVQAPLASTTTNKAGGVRTSAVDSPLSTNPSPVAPKSGMLSVVRLPLFSSGKAPVVVVTLAYAASFAGQTIWVQPLQGGSCSTTDSKGNTTTTTAGFTLALDASGAASFLFQPQDRAGTFQVHAQLGNATTTLCFLTVGADS